MDMQREDFLKLCSGPVKGGVYFYDTPRGSGFSYTHCGSGIANQRRILEDWFPAGFMFKFLGAVCMSRGVIPALEGFGVRLEVLSNCPVEGYKTLTFSVREALSIAQQCCVDNINWLDRMEKTKWDAESS